MVFNSFIFIFVFLPLIVLLYFLANKLSRTAGKIVLLIGNIAFYFYGGWKFALVTAGSLVVNYLISLIIRRNKKYKKPLFITGIVINILFLFAFKYVTPMFNLLFNIEITFFSLLIPLGISYYTLQNISFLTHVYKGDIKDFKPLDYFIYILFFPKIMMGPLMEYDTFVAQLNDDTRKSFNIDHFLQGLKLFCFGLFKKVVIADTFALAVTYGFGHTDMLTSMDVFITMLSYTFQLYFDFSGYSDMAVGIALMLNFDLPINFDSPYKSISPRDFWKRWHISLTRFLTYYIYIPLGGNKKGTLMTCINVLIVFLISGLWHGANLTFVLWGAIWGFLSVVDRFIPRYKTKEQKVVGWVVTFALTNILWLLFRSESIEQWWLLLTKLFKINDLSYSERLVEVFSTQMFDSLNYIWPVFSSFKIMLILFIVASFICFIPQNNYRKKEVVTIPNMVVSGLLLTISILNLVTSGTFLYFGF